MKEQYLFNEAVAYAAMKHAGQTRKDGTPYIYHPLKVAELVKEAGYDLKYQMVAVLHDTLEDTDATEDEIRLFGEDVLEAVRLVTRPEGMDEAEYVAKILENRMASAVKNADKIHNMIDLRTCGNPEWAKKYAKKVRRYYFGKFSSTLDIVISDIETGKNNSEIFGPYYCCTKELMMLHADTRSKRYNEHKKWYFGDTEHLDVMNPKLEYWRDEVSKLYFCSLEFENFWALLDGGWMPIDFHPFEGGYASNMHAVSREWIKEEINRLQAEGWFHDFVDVTKL